MADAFNAPHGRKPVRDAVADVWVVEDAENGDAFDLSVSNEIKDRLRIRSIKRGCGFVE
jgi:hypothetical protein